MSLLVDFERYTPFICQPMSMPSYESRIQDVIAYGMKFQGTPYQFGGDSLTKGIDSSHFIYQVFTDNGFDCPSPGVANMAARMKRINDGTQPHKHKVKTKPGVLSDLLPGDIIVYHKDKGYPWHIALYIGDGQTLEAREGARAAGGGVPEVIQKWWYGTYRLKMKPAR